MDRLDRFLLRAVARWALRKNVVVEGLELMTRDGQRIALAVSNGPPARNELVRREVGLDFRSILWDGETYTFSPYQAPIVRMLWEAMKRGTPDVPSDLLLRGARCESRKMSDIFKGNPAWNRLIRSPRRGFYRFDV